MKKNILFMVLTAVCLSACTRYTEGDLPPKPRLDSIQVGDSKEKVDRVLGSPLFESRVGTPFYLYGKSVKETRGFLDPKETERNVYVINFTNNGAVSSVQHLTLAQASSVSYDSSKTPTKTEDVSLFNQLIQNLGKYDTGEYDSLAR